MRHTQAAIACLALGLSASTATAASFQSLYSFSGTDGALPYGKLVLDSSGMLYGVTVTGGTAQRGNIYQFDPTTKTVTTLYSFSGNADGSSPQSGLTADGKGNLYGVTPRGGVNCSQGCGTLFVYNIAKAKFTTLYSFTGLADGSEPIASPYLSHGVLYGATLAGGTGGDCGTEGCGTLFSFSLKTHSLTVTRQLMLADGLDDQAKFAAAKTGPFINTAGVAGANGSGTVFSFDPATNAYAVVHSFDYHVDGFMPFADGGLKGDVLYGTTAVGGPTQSDAGTIFQLNLSSGVLTTLYSFNGQTDGDSPAYGATLGAKGRLYGVTVQGGSSGAGTLFEFDTTTMTFKMIHDFAISDGTSPAGPLLLGPGGVLYGVTSGGGRGDGTIYSYRP